MKRLVFSSLPLILLISTFSGEAQSSEAAAQAERGRLIGVFESSDGAAPAIRTKLGTVRTHTCRYAFDRSAAKTEIKNNLRMRAMALGGNGVVDVSYAPYTYNHKDPCRMGLSGEGTAVVFIPSDAGP